MIKKGRRERVELYRVASEPKLSLLVRHRLAVEDKLSRDSRVR